jgi:protein phosphatase
MTAPIPAGHASLATPLDPGAVRRIGAGIRASIAVQQAVYTTAFSRIDAAVATACGERHDVNEDAHSALGGAGGLFVVADGVGGGAMAELASRELVAQLHAALEGQRLDAGRIGAAMLEADRAIARLIADVTDAPGAATVALCAPANAFASKWLIAWVGDCRAYRLEAGAGIELLTRDDTFRRLGEAPPCGSAPDDPARMVGNGATTGANVASHDLGAGALLALCSDGVHKHLDADDWQRLLTPPAPLVRRCQALVATARAHGSRDDATVLLLQRSSFALPRWIARPANGGDAEGSDR